MADKHRVPAHLMAATKRWVRLVIEDYDLDPHHFRILIQTAQAWDRAEQARETLAGEGLTVVDRYGTPKAHPCVAIERDSRTAFFRGLRELALDTPGPEAPRAPRTPDYGSRR